MTMASNPTRIPSMDMTPLPTLLGSAAGHWQTCSDALGGDYTPRIKVSAPRPRPVGSRAAERSRSVDDRVLGRALGGGEGVARVRVELRRVFLLDAVVAVRVDGADRADAVALGERAQPRTAGRATGHVAVDAEGRIAGARVGEDLVEAVDQVAAVVLARRRITEVIDLIVDRHRGGVDGKATDRGVQRAALRAGGRDHRKGPVVLDRLIVEATGRGESTVDDQRGGHPAAPLGLRAGVRGGRVELGDERPVPGEPTVRAIPRAVGGRDHDGTAIRPVSDDRPGADVVTAVQREQHLAGRGHDLATLRPAGTDHARAAATWLALVLDECAACALDEVPRPGV